MKLFLVAALAAFCFAAASAEKVELPPMVDYKKLSTEELLAKAAETPGLEYLNDPEKMSAIGIEASRIDPDILEDSMLLTVRKKIEKE